MQPEAGDVCAGDAGVGGRVIVAALFVQKGGAYFGLEDVDPWDKERDARLYAGPWPVVAHPPCERWSIMNNVSKGHGRDPAWGQDGGCFESALRSVQTFGGVLEHPAESKAFVAHGLPRPGRGWCRTFEGDWVTEVNQAAYGNILDKRTWLFYSGRRPPNPLTWRLVKGTHTMGCKTPRSRPEAPKSARSRTPTAFRECLLSLARHAAKHDLAIAT